MFSLNNQSRTRGWEMSEISPNEPLGFVRRGMGAENIAVRESRVPWCSVISVALCVYVFSLKGFLCSQETTLQWTQRGLLMF